MNLSEHFTLEELIASQTAARLGLDNSPSPDALENLRHLCETILEPARLALGSLHISSGYRAPAVDDAIPRAVPNASPSAHRLGHAADAIPLQVGKLTFACWVYEWAPFDQIILEFGTPQDPAWIHVSSAPALRREVLRILPGTGYELATL